MPLPMQAVVPLQSGIPIVPSIPVEPMDLSDNEGESLVPETHEPQQVFNPTLDLEGYASNYKSLARINRLMFIADHCPPMRVDALLMALNFVKENTFNCQMYQQIHSKLQQAALHQTNGAEVADVLPRNQVPAYDQQWVEQAQKKAAMKLEKLDTDLKHYKSNSIKESIRRGQDDLGEHYLDMGDLTNALKCFSRARDYCTTNKHIVSMCFNVIKVSAYLNNWSLVLSYVNRAESTPELAQTAAPTTKDNAAIQRLQTLTKLKCAAGLAELSAKKYKSAARHFLQANADYMEYSELLSPTNVAAYGSLCALATFDRQELQRNVIANSTFRPFLELEPMLSDILVKFYESKYAQCLKLMGELKENLLLDMYLAPHVGALYTMIRNRGLIQYFSPYLSADMHKMAACFNTTVSALEDELMQLILDGQIKARIDSHNKVLYAKDVDQRTAVFEQTLQAAAQYEQRTSALILRAAMHKAGVYVKAPPRGEGQSDITMTPAQSSTNSPTGTL